MFFDGQVSYTELIGDLQAEPRDFGSGCPAFAVVGLSPQWELFFSTVLPEPNSTCIAKNYFIRVATNNCVIMN